MLKYKKILLSLLLCITLFSVSCFATTMTESEIKSAFTDLVDDSTIWLLEDLDSSELSYNSSAMSEYLEENSISGPYIQYVTNIGGGTGLMYIDLGSSTISSIFYNDGAYFTFSSPVTAYYVESVASDDDWGSVYQYSNYNNQVTGVISNNFDTAFTYSSNAIFTEPSTPSPSPSGIFAGILATMTYILSSITTVMNSLVQVDLILFVILASLCISIIYFVIKLLKGFTGNKLVSGKKRK